MGSEADYSRAALARFIEYVVGKNLVNPATAQGWRVATSKVLEGISEEGSVDVRRIDLDATFRAFLHASPGRLAPASVGEYRRRVARAIEEFVRWVEDPGAYAFRGGYRPPKAEARRGGGGGAEDPSAASALPDVQSRRTSVLERRSFTPDREREPGIALDYPLRPDLLAQVIIPRDLTVEEARRMGAFLVTLAVDFRPALLDPR